METIKLPWNEWLSQRRQQRATEPSAMYEDLMIASVMIFCLSVPALLYARTSRPEMPWWLVVLAATVSGWLLVNAHALSEHLWIDEDRHEVAACFQGFPSRYSELPTPEPVTASGGMQETVVENPCPLVDYYWESYQPILGLMYGPVYLLCCGIPYCLLMGRLSSRRTRVQVFLIAAATLIMEWISIIGSHPHLYNLEGAFGIRGSFISPAFTVGIALTVASIVVTQIILRFDHHSNGSSANKA